MDQRKWERILDAVGYGAYDPCREVYYLLASSVWREVSGAKPLTAKEVVFLANGYGCFQAMTGRDVSRYVERFLGNVIFDRRTASIPLVREAAGTYVPTPAFYGQGIL